MIANDHYRLDQTPEGSQARMPVQTVDPDSYPASRAGSWANKDDPTLEIF
jgi:hypothetical protein